MRYIFTTLILFFEFTSLWAIDSFVDIKKFNTTDNKPFAEIHLLIPGQSLNFKVTDANAYQAEVEVLMIIESADTVAAFDKYVLKSELLKEANTYINLIDLKRFSLQKGRYSLEVKCSDLKADSTIVSVTNANFSIGFPPEQISIADITLTEKVTQQEEAATNIYTKSGYEIIPNVINFYSKKINELGFYTEIYNADKVIADDGYLISYAITKPNNFDVVQGFKKFKKATASPLEPLLAVFNIEDLKSGNYDLLVEARNKKNELLASKRVPFQRSKPIDAEKAIADLMNNGADNTFVHQQYTSGDTLSFYLGSLQPIAPPDAYAILGNAIKSRDKSIMQNVLYDFLKQTYPLDTEGEFEVYKTVVNAVNDKFGTIMLQGHETDRGRMFLKYGQPSEIIPITEAGSVPSEIWIYDVLKVTNQTNVKSIFYNPDLATNTFPLLHSQIRGERNNPDWEYYLQGLAGSSPGLDNNSFPRSNTYGKKASRIFTDDKSLQKDLGTQDGQ